MILYSLNKCSFSEAIQFPYKCIYYRFSWKVFIRDVKTWFFNQNQMKTLLWIIFMVIYKIWNLKKKNLPTNLNKCHIKRQSNVHIDISVSLDPCHLPAFNRKCICMHVSTSGTFSCKNNTTTDKVPARKNIKFTHVLYIPPLYHKSLLAKKQIQIAHWIFTRSRQCKILRVRFPGRAAGNNCFIARECSM